MGHTARWNEFEDETIPRIPRPLNLNERQAFAWQSEYCAEAKFNYETPDTRRGWTVECDGEKTTESTLLEAICQAAAIHARDNDIPAEKMERVL